MGQFFAKTSSVQTQCYMHYISQEIDPKGKVNMHCSRHALIGLFGHCPEAKTHFTVLNPKHRFKYAGLCPFLEIQSDPLTYKGHFNRFELRRSSNHCEKRGERETGLHTNLCCQSYCPEITCKLVQNIRLCNCRPLNSNCCA